MKKLVCVACLMSGMAVIANGSLLLEETFDGMTAGGLNAQNGWSAVANMDVVAGGLSYGNGDINIDGGEQHVRSTLVSTGIASPLATKSFTSQDDQVWFSLTLSVTNTANNTRYWFWASDTTNINAGITGAIATSSTGNNQLFAEVRNNTSGSSESLGTLVDGTVYYLVGRLSKDGTATNTNA